MTARIVLPLAAVAGLLVSLVLMVLDDRPDAPEPSELREGVPFTIDGQAGYRCDITVRSNGVRADTAEAECEGP